jgi:hypothetical protein
LAVVEVVFHLAVVEVVFHLAAAAAVVVIRCALHAPRCACKKRSRYGQWD